MSIRSFAVNAPFKPSAIVTDAWQQHTLRGNTEYQLACYNAAIAFHTRALEHAHKDFPENARVCVQHAIARVLISHFSLADCHRALADYARAAECFVEAQRFLLQCNRELPACARTRHAVNHANLHLLHLWSELVSAHADAIPTSCRCAFEEGDAQLTHNESHVTVLH